MKHSALSRKLIEKCGDCRIIYSRFIRLFGMNRDERLKKEKKMTELIAL